MKITNEKLGKMKKLICIAGISMLVIGSFFAGHVTNTKAQKETNHVQKFPEIWYEMYRDEYQTVFRTFKGNNEARLVVGGCDLILFFENNDLQ